MLKQGLKVLFFTIFFACLGYSNVSANSINSIDKTVVLNQDGSAHVTEVWQANLTQGTEGYESFSDLRGKVIENFTVTDESGRTYESQSFWNTNGNFSQKAYKSGINYTASGLELCWGITEYGNRTYTLDYDIKNLVNRTSDGVAYIHFNFLNLNQPVSKTTVTFILNDNTPLTVQNSRIWGFGYTGEANFSDNGSILFASSSKLDLYDYMIALIRFEPPLFENASLIESDQSFDDIYSEALEGSDYAKKRESYYASQSSTSPDLIESKRIIGTYVLPVLYLIILLPIIKLFLPSLHILPDPKYSDIHLESANTLDYLKDKIPGSNEIPCKKQIPSAFWLITNYSISTERQAKIDLISAMILRLVSKKQIGFEKRTDIFWKRGKEVYYLDLRRATGTTELEKEFIKILKAAARPNGLLEKKEFKRWSKLHYRRLSNWFDQAFRTGEEEIKDLGLCGKRTVENRGWLWTKRHDEDFYTNDSTQSEAAKLIALKKYLLNFSTITKEVGVNETVIWEDYLVFAALLGISYQVREQLKALYPKVIAEWTVTQGELDFILDFVSDISSMAYIGMAAGIASAATRKEIIHSAMSWSGGSDWSGGGGSSSSGGGGSSGGSSGGGFR